MVHTDFSGLSSVTNLPTPSSISYMWSFGSLLGLCLYIQIITGLFLSMYYVAESLSSFFSVLSILRDVDMGWLIRVIHANGASIFFFCIYIHVARGVYYKSYKFYFAWFVGVTIILVLIAISFLGYVLPWGQMSFWGATVITNLLSALPYVGPMIVEWLWGGFSVGYPTLIRFYSFHFILPFFLTFLVILHLIFLHNTGSSNPLGIGLNLDKLVFHPFFTFSDVVGFSVFIFLGFYFCLSFSYLLNDPENFIPSNSLVTPNHISPEWYFLFAYCVLRSIPSNLGGVVILVISIVIFFFVKYLYCGIIGGLKFYFINLFLTGIFFFCFFFLTYLGGCAVEYPYYESGQFFTFVYFFYFFLNSFYFFLWDYLLGYLSLS